MGRNATCVWCHSAFDIDATDGACELHDGNWACSEACYLEAEHRIEETRLNEEIARLKAEVVSLKMEVGREKREKELHEQDARGFLDDMRQFAEALGIDTTREGDEPGQLQILHAIDGLKAEVERMRPVVEAAVRYNELRYSTSAPVDEYDAAQEKFNRAVRAYRAGEEAIAFHDGREA